VEIVEVQHTVIVAIDGIGADGMTRYSILWPFWKYAARNLCIFPDLAGIS